MKTLILATHNTGKIAELRALLSPIQCISESQLHIKNVEETGLTFIENALLKARHASQHAQLPALADDSGLVVPALMGQPGIFSARFASAHASDQDNMQTLLARMENIPDENRHAYFYCALVLLQHAQDPTPLIATGIWHGRIIRQPEGTHGFGYDPIFYLDEHHLTAAALSGSVKNQISHRAKACQALKTQLASLL